MPRARAAGLERLWSPWRMAYIRRAAPPADCLFCRVAAGRSDRRDLVLVRRPHTLLRLNRYPYAPAHLMIAVTRHVDGFAALTDAERADWMAMTALAERALEGEYRPDGMNLGVNRGRVAGAGFPGHLHQHLVPRWSGDTNFMGVVAETRVLPEDLAHSAARLRPVFERIARQEHVEK